MFCALKFSIKTSPRRSAGSPDIRGGLNGRWIIKITDSHDSEFWSGICLVKKVSATSRAELLSNFTATICGSNILRKSASKSKRRHWHNHVHGSVCGNMLAIPAPANANGKRICAQFKAHRTAQTLPCSLCHLNAPWGMTPLNG
jgi:hypothetical protein